MTRPARPNGFGPWWMPAPVRAVLTRFSAWFFDEASWQRHDIGYAHGYPSRAEADRKFLAAMLRDASQAERVWHMAAACVLAWLFWGVVRLFGWMSYGRARRR